MGTPQPQTPSRPAEMNLAEASRVNWGQAEACETGLRGSFSRVVEWAGGGRGLRLREAEPQFCGCSSSSDSDSPGPPWWTSSRKKRAPPAGLRAPGSRPDCTATSAQPGAGGGAREEGVAGSCPREPQVTSPHPTPYVPSFGETQASCSAAGAVSHAVSPPLCAQLSRVSRSPMWTSCPSAKCQACRLPAPHCACPQPPGATPRPHPRTLPRWPHSCHLWAWVQAGNDRVLESKVPVGLPAAVPLWGLWGPCSVTL